MAAFPDHQHHLVSTAVVLRGAARDDRLQQVGPVPAEDGTRDERGVVFAFSPFRTPHSSSIVD
jgi:hypothetical protein